MTLPVPISKLANSVRIPCGESDHPVTEIDFEAFGEPQSTPRAGWEWSPVRTYSLVQLRGLVARSGSIG